jgi:hypothetical protein
MSKKIDRIEAKKRELEADLERLQSGLESNLVNVKSDVTQSIHPTEVVKKYPLPVVGAAIVAGFLITRIGRGKSEKSTSNKSVIADSISSSLKKRLSKKATDMVLDYIEDRLTSTSEASKDS